MAPTSALKFDGFDLSELKKLNANCLRVYMQVGAPTPGLEIRQVQPQKDPCALPSFCMFGLSHWLLEKLGDGARLLQQLVGGSPTLENILREQQGIVWREGYSDPASNVDCVRQGSWPFTLERDIVWRARTVLELSRFVQPTKKRLTKGVLVMKAEHKEFMQLLQVNISCEHDCVTKFLLHLDADAREKMFPPPDRDAKAPERHHYDKALAQWCRDADVLSGSLVCIKTKLRSLRRDDSVHVRCFASFLMP